MWALNWPGKLARPSLGQGESGVSSWQAGRRHAVGRQMARVLGQGAARAEAGGQTLWAKDGLGPLPWREKLSSPGWGPQGGVAGEREFSPGTDGRWAGGSAGREPVHGQHSGFALGSPAPGFLQLV